MVFDEYLGDFSICVIHSKQFTPIEIPKRPALASTYCIGFLLCSEEQIDLKKNKHCAEPIVVFFSWYNIK